ncbi:MAG: mevalonate kinase [Thiomicrorhabdus sp.]|nr:MAG: mevalonate kinase [Thiomicrorhabdus sp.]
MKTHCAVPAKLILSGEHAVLYHCPALSMAIDLKTHCWAAFQASETSSITIELVNFQQKHKFPTNVWRQMAMDIECRFQLFEESKGSIQSVLANPIDLIIEVLYHFESLCPLKNGEWQFKINSDVPIGRGLGSSAAVILSLLSSLIKQHALDVSADQLLVLAQQIECRQHGNSSGIDPATLIYGGLLQYQNDQPIKQIEPLALKGWLIDTNKPASSTGQCVMQVREQHAADKELWKAFKAITLEMVKAWKSQHSTAFKEAIRQNHQLLVKIGVVPNRVQTFIQTLEADYDAAAKVCGAGSITGDSAGMLLCISEQAPEALCKAYQYTYQPLVLQTKGVLCEDID